MVVGTGNTLPHGLSASENIYLTFTFGGRGCRGGAIGNHQSSILQSPIRVPERGGTAGAKGGTRREDVPSHDSRGSGITNHQSSNHQSECLKEAGPLVPRAEFAGKRCPATIRAAEAKAIFILLDTSIGDWRIGD